MSSRREFMGHLAVGLVAAPAPFARKIWIDPKLAGLPARPWRKVHLDFHNSQHVAHIAERFNADEFGDRLLEGNVDSVVVFAKDMHGYFYYPSRYGPVHPGLRLDLLGPQVEACRKRKIAAYAYYCTTWDNYLAEHHPEWRVIKRGGGDYYPSAEQTPSWTALCLAYEPFVQLMIDHTREFVSKYPIDGAWFDMPVPIAGECFCPECMRQLRAKGLDPQDRRVQREHKHALHKSFIERMQKVVTGARPGCQVDFNGQCVYGLGERVPFMDNVDIEALPTASWGYYYFPTMVRYARTFGVTTYGMTGRFKASWADFGGLKLPAQLDAELAAIVANGARCDIGDQMPPNGRLDAAVYHVIGKSYGRIKTLEPYLEGAVPVTEAALVTGGLPLANPSTDANYGLVKLLIESRVQFDLVEPAAAWERYGLIVLPDDMRIDDALAARLDAYISKGGAVLASHLSGVLASGDKSWLERYGLHYAGLSPFKPAYLVPQAAFTGDIPPYEYALYEGASQWRAEKPAKVVAQLGEPAFQRSPQHYTSHAQSPFDHATPFAAVAISGSVGLFGFPLGLSYYNQGYWIYRQAFGHVLKQLLPTPLVASNAPLSSEITVTHQARQRRYMVHVVNFSPLRRAPRHPDFYEDPIPLTNVTVRLNLPVKGKARAVVAGLDLVVRDGEVTIPSIPVHEVISFEA